MSCAGSESVGELGDACRRLRALEPWWREEQVDAIREAMADAAALPERQARAMEALRAAEDARTLLVPDGIGATQDVWRHAQGSVAQCRVELVSLRQVEVALLSLLDCEAWWALVRRWKASVAALNAQERDVK
ncbi:hypothetical protein JY651_28570 [Pyxidicoccus parkwayensis]|uniref:Uncharacterized protein n=1 Tax=Pyxidicoccus parkwayensis TaxID=2813578 RepID=A0ABX7NKA7_9BACT|nr:hypothetical protein [Pyxidicoccus parkwaysis]QSQ19287.1 hypothetical protein JY651_28570 [Pyxidicoccus parkwaysis]